MALRGAALPIEEEQKGQHGQVGRGDIGLLLEADEDDDDQCSGNHIVALEGERNGFVGVANENQRHLSTVNSG